MSGEKRKIVYFHQGYWPGNSPSTTFITFNALGFYKIGCPIELITGRNSHLPVPKVLKEKLGIDAPLKIFPLWAPRVFGSHLLLQLRAFSMLLTSSRVKVLITRALSFLPFALLLKRVKGITVFFEAHDFFTDLSLESNIRKVERKKRYSRIERKYLPKVDGVICISEPQKELYQKYYPKQKFICALTGVKIADSLLPKRSFSYLLGYLGSFDLQRYPLDILIKALTMVRNSQVKLLLIGGKNEKERSTVQEIARKLNVSGRVKVLPWQSPAQVEMWKRKIDVGCAISAPTLWNKIGCQLKVLEYLSAGIPVLATELEGIKQVITSGKHGYLLQNKAEQWASAIDRIYSDLNRYLQLSEECLRKARDLSWEKRARKIIDFIGFSQEGGQKGVLKAKGLSRKERG